MRIRFLAIGLIAGLLAACTGGDDDPKPSPSRTQPRSAATSSATPTSASPSPSRTGPLTTGPNVRPGEKPPVLPAIASQHTQLGAIAFGGYYFKALDWSIATNDATAVVAISAAGCKACARVREAVDTLHRRHQIQKGGRIKVRTFGDVHQKFEVKADYVIRVVYDEDAVQLSGPGQDPRTTVPAARNAASYVFVSWVGGAWKVTEVTEA